MSVSLYYTATRPQPITTQEQNTCDAIAARFDAQYPFGELYEGFCIYDLQKNRIGYEDDVILAGSTKMPPDVDDELFFDILDWWLECTKELVAVLPGAQWHVNLDDMEFRWSDEEQGFVPDV